MTPTRALARLTEHSWPRNVRELRNTLERASVLRDGPVIDARDIDFDPAERPADDSLPSFVTVEKNLLVAGLKKFKGDVGALARAMEMPPSTIYAKIKRLGVDNHPSS